MTNLGLSRLFRNSWKTHFSFSAVCVPCAKWLARSMRFNKTIHFPRSPNGSKARVSPCEVLQPSVQNCLKIDTGSSLRGHTAKMAFDSHAVQHMDTAPRLVCMVYRCSSSIRKRLDTPRLLKWLSEDLYTLLNDVTTGNPTWFYSYSDTKCIGGLELIH